MLKSFVLKKTNKLKSFVLKKSRKTQKNAVRMVDCGVGDMRVPHIYSGHGEMLQSAESTTGMRCQNRCHVGLL